MKHFFIPLWRGLGGGYSTLIFLVTLSLTKGAFSQSPSIIIEPLSDCINYIITFHNDAQKSEEKALQLYKQKKWYTLLPTPGFGFNFITAKPMLTLSLPDYVSYAYRRKDLKYRIIKTKITAQENITTDTVAFKSAYREIETQIKFYNEEKILIAQDSLLLAIKLEENKKLQATTEDVLKLKLSILEKQYNHAKAIQTILSKVSSLESHLHRTFKITLPRDSYKQGEAKTSPTGGGREGAYD